MQKSLKANLKMLFVFFIVVFAAQIHAIEDPIGSQIREIAVTQISNAKKVGGKVDVGPLVNAPLLNQQFDLDAINVQGSMRAVVGGRNFSGADIDSAQIPISTLNGMGLTPLYHDGGEWPGTAGNPNTDSGQPGFGSDWVEAIYDVDGNNHYPKAVLRHIGTHCYIFVPVMYFPTLPRGMSSSEDWTPAARAEWGLYWPDSIGFSNGPWYYAPDSNGTVLEPRFVLGNTKEEARHALRQLADQFDAIIYPKMRQYFGNEPDIDGDPKIFILLDDIRDGSGSFQGYFWGANQFPRSAQPMSNEKELIYIDLFPNFVMNPNSTLRTLAHEFVHMIIFNENYTVENGQLIGMERWLEEGLTTYAEHLFDGSFTSNLDAFIRNPDVILAEDRIERIWLGPNPYANYGASFLWIYYLVEKYGGSNVAAFLKNIVRHPDGGMGAIDAVLKAHDTDAETVFRNWAIANYLNKTHRRDGGVLNDRKWGYNLDNDVNESTYVGAGNTERLPVRFSERVTLSDDIMARSANVNPWAADYIEIMGNSGNLNLGFDGNDRGIFHVGVIKRGPSVDPDVDFFHLDARQSGNLIIQNYGTGNTYENLVLVPMVTNNLDYNKLNYVYSGSFNDLKVAVFPNPVFENHLHVVVRTEDKFSAEPRVKMTFEGEQGYLVMAAVDESTYISTYSLERSGEGAIEASGRNKNGIILSNHLKFTAVHYPAGSEGLLRSSFVSLDIAPNSLKNGGTVVVASADNPISYQGIVRASRNYDIGLPVEKTTKPVQVIIDSTEKINRNRKQSGLYRVAGENAQWLGPVEILDDKVIGEISTSGSVFVAIDKTAPSIDSEAKPVSAGVNNLRVSDEGSGICPDSIVVKYDNRLLPANYEDNIVRINTRSLPKGEHKLAVEVSDRAGNTTKATVRAFVSGANTISETITYPNPARNHTTFRAVLSGPQKELAQASVIIYDTSGHRVRRLTMRHRTDGEYEKRWDLRNRDGQLVANGTYFAEIRVELDGRTRRERLPMAVLR